MTPTPDQQPGYETRDIDFKKLVMLTLWLIILVLVSMIISYGFNRLFFHYSPMHDQPNSPLAELHQVPPEPRLQSNPGIDMIRMRESTTQALTSYGWVDAASGQVRIPIARAMELVAQEGLPARSGSGTR